MAGNRRGMMAGCVVATGVLTVTNTFAVLRLLPVSDRDEDVDILALRHQLAVLERQLGGKKVRFTVPDRAILAALLHRLRPEALHRLRCWYARKRCCAGTEP